MMKRMGSICAIPFLALSFSFGTVSVETDSGLAEAAPPTPQIAQREMKRSKYSQASPIYERAHQLIYGNEDVNGTAGRIRIAVLINGDEKMVVEDRVKNEIYSQLRQKFPREYFALMKGTDINTKLLQYAEDMYYEKRGKVTTTEEMQGSHPPVKADSGVVSSIVNGVADFIGGKQSSGASSSTIRQYREDIVDVDGLPVGMQPRGLADMKREDYVRAGQECGYDYVFIATLTLGQGRDDKHNFVVFNSVSNRQNAWLRLRFVDVNSGNYLYRNDIAVQGVSHNGSRTGRVYQKAIHKAMEEAMNDLDFVN